MSTMRAILSLLLYSVFFSNMKQTKIVATLGPASDKKEILREMILAGMNVARLNFSHAKYDWCRSVVANLRELSEELGTPVALLGDLQGPRIRTELDAPLAVKQGFVVTVAQVTDRAHFTSGEPVFFLDTPGLIEKLRVDERLLIDDGLMELVVTETGDKSVKALVKNDGTIKPRKGVILPETDFTLPILSEKDLADLGFMVEMGVDYVGLSFVGSPEEVELVREKMKALQKEQGTSTTAPLPKLCSKIERKQALKQLRAIIEASDCVMVARGDLGIEMPESEVVLLQKHIISESLKAMRPVIVATQMMQSMVMNPRPTRAEVSDVSNAVIDHTDAVMLSEESANGKYPVETIATMREIIEKTEESPYNDLYQALDLNTYTEYAVMMRSVYELSQSFQAKAILVLSMSGFTAKLLSHFRPDATIYVATNQVATWKELALVWGVQPYVFPDDQKLDSMIERLIERLKQEKKLRAGDAVTVFYGRTPESDSMRLVGMRTIR